MKRLALFLTARDCVGDRVQGLELGPDDYLIKPAPARSLLRRGNSVTVQTSLAIAYLQVDLLKRRVEHGGKRIDLTAKEFMLLKLLLRPGRIIKIAHSIKSTGINFDSDTNN